MCCGYVCGTDIRAGCKIYSAKLERWGFHVTYVGGCAQNVSNGFALDV